MVKPKTIELGTNQAGDKLTFQYVSLIQQCEQLVRHPVVQSSLLCELPDAALFGDGVYGDVRSGVNHQPRKHHLPLFIFYDDFEILNPVGNKAGKHKLGGIYFSLGSVPFRSRKRHVFLLCLCRSTYFKKHRGKILEPLVRDAKFLEETGLPIGVTARGEEIRAKISIEVLIGDNLGCHTLGGYTQNFSTARKVCRFCYATPDTIQMITAENECVPRTAELYEEELSRLREANFDEHLCNQIGIKTECELNALASFHVVESLPPDYAHDVLEGSARLVIGAVLTELVKTRTVTLDTVNQALLLFPYSRGEENRPESLKWVKGQVVCKATAKECWTLLRLLPLIIGGHIPEGNQTWEIFLTYLTLVRLIISPSFKDAELTNLQSLIEQWLRKFKGHFEGIRITPKLHYLLHYSNEIRKHGALSSVSTLRYEHKHQQLKKFLETSRNYKNPAYTLAWRHQLWIAPKMSSEDFFTYKESIVPCSAADADVPADATDSSHVALQGVVKGTTYRQGSVLCFNDAGAVRPQMGRVKALLKNKLDGNVSFFCQRMDILGYSRHLGAFEVRTAPGVVTVPHHLLCDTHPLALYLGRYVVEHHFILGLHQESTF